MTEASESSQRVTSDLLQNLSSLLRERKFSEVQNRAVELVSGSGASHPQLWVFLAESLEHQNNLVDAWAAYNRAWILDPAAAWASSKKEQCADSADLPPSEWMQRLLEVKKVSVGAALIVKDESGSIEQVVTQLKKAVDEVIVVDTGSSDDTFLLAQKSGATVFNYEWDDSFSNARNFALSKISSDWVMFVDGDEVLWDADTDVPRTVAGLFNDQEHPVVVRVVQVNYMNGRAEPNYDMSRLFPTRFGLRWWGRVHEQVGPPDGGVLKTTYARPLARIRLNHHGYNPDVMISKDKLNRNIGLLKKSVEEDDSDIASWGFLGREYYFSGMYEKAVRILYRTEEMSRYFPTYGRLSEVRTYLAEALIRLDRLEEAQQVSRRMTEKDPYFPTGWYIRGRIDLAQGVQMLQQAKASFEEAQRSAPHYRGLVSYDSSIPSYRAIVGLADVAKLQGRWIEALGLYNQALNSVQGAPEVDVQINYLRTEAGRVVSAIDNAVS